MERRSFLRTVAASLLAALEPFKAPAATPEPQLATVLGGIAIDEPEHTTYVIERAVLVAETSPAFLVQDVVIHIHDDNGPPRCDVTIYKLMGPSAHVCRLFNTYGDASNAHINPTLKLGLPKSDGTQLWIELPHAVLCSVGVSVRTTNAASDDLMLSDQLQFITKIPNVTDNTRTQPITDVTQHELEKALCLIGP